MGDGGETVSFLGDRVDVGCLWWVMVVDVGEPLGDLGIETILR